MENNSITLTLAETVEYLKANGYKKEFRRDPSFIYCVEMNLWMSTDEFKIDESYLFEEVSSPDADRVLYAISAFNGVKGILVDGYGVYADSISDEMAEKLSLTNPILNIGKQSQFEYEKSRITYRRFS